MTTTMSYADECKEAAKKMQDAGYNGITPLNIRKMEDNVFVAMWKEYLIVYSKNGVNAVKVY